MSFQKTLTHRVFRRLSESDMIVASARYEVHNETEPEAASTSNPNELHSNYQSSTPATKRRDIDPANLSTPTLKQLKKNLIKKKNRLQPVLTLLDLTVFGICQVIGSGIYVLAGTAGKDFAGSGLFISFIIGAISAGASAICYAEFASRIPVIGGSYMYTYYSSGELLGFLSGFLTFLRGFFALAGNAVAWTGYFRSFLSSLDKDVDKLSDDGEWTSYLFGHTIQTRSGIVSSVNLLAPCAILILAAISAYGIKTSANFMNIVAVWNVSLICFFIASGALLFDFDIFVNPCDHPEFGNECNEDVNQDAFLPFGIDGVFAASGLAFWAYVGLEGIASVAEESVEPKRDVPRAIYIVLCIVSALYISVAVILLGIVPFQALDEDAPLAEAFTIHDEKLLQQIASFGALTQITVVNFATLINRPRSLYRIALDGLLCNVFSCVHNTRHTPMVAIFTMAFLGMIVSTFFNITEILQVASVTALLQYAVVAGGVIIIRYSPPKPSRTFNESKYLKKQQKPIKYEYSGNSNNDWTQSLGSIDNGSMETSNSSHLVPSLVLITSFWTHFKVFSVVWSWVIACLFTSFIVVERDAIIDISKGFWYFCLCIGGTVLLASFILIIYMDHSIPWKTYVNKKKFIKIVWTPACPYLPLFAVAINSFIIANYRFYVFIRIFVALAIGVIVYFIYGYHHSKLNGKGDISAFIHNTIYGSSDEKEQDTQYEDNEYFSQPRALSVRSLSDVDHAYS